jgi:hypothetical protein
LLILTRFVCSSPAKTQIRPGKGFHTKWPPASSGTHFKEVSDVLLNTLQLNSLAAETTQQEELILASINQKVEKLKPIPFATAIDLSKNRKYLYYALPPVLILLLFLLFSPKAITGPEVG